MRFKLLVIDSWPDGSVAHAVSYSTWEAICGAGIDLRLDHVSERWYSADEASRIECPECRRIVEPRAA